MSEIEIYETFPIILKERLSYTRKTNGPLAGFSFILASWIAQTRDSAYLREILDRDVHRILRDCEIFHQMSYAKALDALDELSELATIYSLNQESDIYNKICLQIREIIASYPVQKM